MGDRIKSLEAGMMEIESMIEQQKLLISNIENDFEERNSQLETDMANIEVTLESRSEYIDTINSTLVTKIGAMQNEITEIRDISNKFEEFEREEKKVLES